MNTNSDKLTLDDLQDLSDADLARVHRLLDLLLKRPSLGKLYAAYLRLLAWLRTV
jgi:hypothetical protein